MTSSGSMSTLRRIGNLLRVEQQRQASANGMSVAQLDALHYLSLCNRYSDTPIGVADYLGASKGTVSQSLSALEAKGLIKKVADPDDGRVTHCRLTRKGKNLVTATTSPTEVAADADQELLVELLRQLQVANGRRTFGACHSCAHFRPAGRRAGPANEASQEALCGLTLERLNDDDQMLICREHNFGPSEPD